MVQHTCNCVYQININTNALAFKTVQYFSLLSITKLVVETYININAELNNFFRSKVKITRLNKSLA